MFNVSAVLCKSPKMRKTSFFQVARKLDLKQSYTWAWQCAPLIPALRRQRQGGTLYTDQSQPGLYSEFQGSWGYRETVSQKDKNKTKQSKTKQKNHLYKRSEYPARVNKLKGGENVHKLLWWLQVTSGH